MKQALGLFVMMFALSIFSYGQMTPVGPKQVKCEPMKQQPVKVIPLELPEGYNSGQVMGNLKDGVRILNLRWAESSSVACFPGTRFEMFTGNHVFYRITLPAQALMKIIVEPQNGKQISLYALRQGMNRQQVPPDVKSAISCEASYPIYADLRSGRRVTNKDDGKRRVEYMSVNSSYSILIGVAGANGLTEGDFKLGIQLTARR